MVGIGKVQLNFSNTNQIKGSDTMQFLTDNRPAPAPLTSLEINMAQNAGRCWSQAERWGELGEVKLAADLEARGHELIKAARGDDVTRWQMAYMTAMKTLSKCRDERGEP